MHIGYLDSQYSLFIMDLLSESQASYSLIIMHLLCVKTSSSIFFPISS